MAKVLHAGRESRTRKVHDLEFAMFKMPAYDPFSIAVMGFGILWAVAYCGLSPSNGVLTVAPLLAAVDDRERDEKAKGARSWYAPVCLLCAGWLSLPR